MPNALKENAEKCKKISELKLENVQCDFGSDRSSTDQIFTLEQIFEKSWKREEDFLHSLLIHNM